MTPHISLQSLPPIKESFFRHPTKKTIEMAGSVVAVTIALLMALQAPIATTTRLRKLQSTREQLAHAAVSASLAQAKSALAAISSAAESVAPLKPGESMVLRDCLTTMRDSVQKLQKSQGEMGEGKAWVENARTWLSAALTEDNMCADELQGVDLAGRREAVRGLVVLAARRTSDALALISNLGSSSGIEP
ncbi:pectinesterase inhibitor 3-like [Dendrobium catenatum]|uniref:pectinesterase inhibitor 3-like n=1 Tax=Dendrobium catenatum TaxID=906689 RepID=UPI0009F74338|nr:pectinesterase inhibitor 3-like [Dendrobium catenatum]